jgi:hypothetical protein
VLFAGAAGAGFIAADLRRGANILLDGRVVIVAVVAVRAMNMAGLAVIVVVMIMVMVAIWTVDMRGGSGLDGIGHEKGL